MQTMILQRYRLTKSGITIYGKEGSEGKRNMNMNMKIGANRDERFKGIIETRASGAFGSIGFHSAGTENAAAGTAGGFAAAWADLLLSKHTGEAQGDYAETGAGEAAGKEALLAGGTKSSAA